MIRLLIVLALAGLLCEPAFGDQKDAAVKGSDAQDRQARARERCIAQRGTNCNTPQGLREWLLQERSRAEAIRDGSRHRLPPR